jgi:hypothetical protein
MKITGLKNYVKNNTSNSLREYLIDLDTKINITNYSNKDLKEHIENNYNISFSKRNLNGRDYVNYNTFRKIAGEVRTKKRIYTAIQRPLLKKEDQKRANTYEEIKDLLSINKENKELSESLEVTLQELNDYVYTDVWDIVVKHDNKEMSEYDFNIYYSKIELYRKNNELKKINDLNEKMSKRIITYRKDKEFGRGLENYNNIVNLEKYVKSCKLIDSSIKMKSMAVDTKDLNTLRSSQSSEKYKDITVIYSDGINMMSLNYDLNGNVLNNEFAKLNKTNINNLVVTKSSHILETYSSKYGVFSMLSALKESSILAVQGNPNFSFEELLQKYESMN